MDPLARQPSFLRRHLQNHPDPSRDLTPLLQVHPLTRAIGSAIFYLFLQRTINGRLQTLSYLTSPDVKGNRAWQYLFIIWQMFLRLMLNSRQCFGVKGFLMQHRSIGYFDLLRFLQYYSNEYFRNESYMVEKWYISLSSVDFNCFLSYVIEGRVGRISN